MFDFHEKRKIRSILYSKATILALLVCAAFLSVSVYGRYEIAREMEQKLEAKEDELRAVEARAAALEAKVRYLENDRGLEEELRNRFDVVRDGEQTVILIDSREGSGKSRSAPNFVPPSPEPDDRTFLEMLKFWE